MQYVKLSFIKIPYKITSKGNHKVLKIGFFSFPFDSFTTNEGQKYYRIFGVKLKFSFLSKLFVTRRQVNFQKRNEWSDERIKKEAIRIFKEKQGYEPDLENPKSFNEKIFWMKLNYKNPLITKCCDKYSVKDYVSEQIGSDFIVPTIASWESADEIDFTNLPHQFVLKVNWSSGYNIIVKDKTDINEDEIRNKIRKWMQPERNSYYQSFNWGYKDMKPIVYAEEYIEHGDEQLLDYKFYCANGKAVFLYIASNRFNENAAFDFFDIDFNKLDLFYGGRKHSETELKKPNFYDDMIRYAEILSKPFPFVRVDFYEVGDRLYVGEMTFYSGGGILKFEPIEWDYKLGEYFDLTSIIKGD